MIRNKAIVNEENKLPALASGAETVLRLRDMLPLPLIVFDFLNAI